MAKRLFTYAEIRAIRAAKKPAVEIAAEFRVSPAMVSLIRTRKVYKDLRPPGYKLYQANYRIYTDPRGYDLYVHCDGHVWSAHHGYWLKCPPNADGYAIVSLNGVPLRLNRLVLTLFDRPPVGDEQARHKNGDLTNNALYNLVWGTAKQNAADKVGHGTDPAGERNPAAKITNRDVQDIRKAYETHVGSDLSFAKLMTARYPVGRTTINNIIKDRSWNGR